MSEDIVEEILVRLPAQSLLRFRCVCKSWYALIKSSRFINHHHVFQRSIGNDRIIVKYFKKAEKKYVISYFSDYEYLSLLISAPEIKIPSYNFLSWPPIFIGEVNGIVCLSDINVRITLMNPALREFRILPPLDVSYLANFEYNHLYPGKKVGFGFDESRNDYKVLMLNVFQRNILGGTGGYEEIHYGAIYSLTNNSWRELGLIPLLDSYHICYINLPYLFFKGSLYWYGESRSNNKKKDMIITFNMTTELFQEMQPPQDQPEGYLYYTLLFLVDKSFLKFVSITDSRFLNVWVMKEYGMEDSWTNEYRISLNIRVGRPLSFWKNDKLFFTPKNATELICYDLPTGQIHQFQRFGCSNYMAIGLVVYHESLLSINNI